MLLTLSLIQVCTCSRIYYFNLLLQLSTESITTGISCKQSRHLRSNRNSAEHNSSDNQQHWNIGVQEMAGQHRTTHRGCSGGSLPADTVSPWHMRLSIWLLLLQS